MLRRASARSQRRPSRHWSHTIRDEAPHNIARGYHVARDAGDLDAAGRAYQRADAYPSADTSADGCTDQRVCIQGAGPPRETLAGCHAACAKRHATGTMRRAPRDSPTLQRHSSAALQRCDNEWQTPELSLVRAVMRAWLCVRPCACGRIHVRVRAGMRRTGTQLL